MKSEWTSFLTQTGAILDEGRVLHYGDPDEELRLVSAGDIICDLSHLGLIAVSGPDAQTFLQGQLTSDVRQVTPEQSQLGAYCNSKGRMLASFRLFQCDDGYYLGMPRPMVAPTLKRLQMFVLRAKMTLEDASESLLRIGLSGPNAQTLLHNNLGTTPAQVDAVVQTKAITAIRLPGMQPRFQLHGRLEAIKALWQALAGQTAPVGAEPWELLDIQAGIPTIYPETVEAFVPQMTNLQLINGISFQKGCYTGQEVVARTQYLGRLKRRMYRAYIDSATRPRPGDELFSPQSDPNQSAGRIIAACRHPDGGYEALAVVLIECAEHGTVLLGNEGEPPLRFQPLPYAFDNAAA